MRILRVIDTLDPGTGGPISGLRSLTPVLAALGHATVIVTVDSPDAGDWSLPGAEVVSLGPVRGQSRTAPALRPWLDRNIGDFDAIVVHGLWQSLGRTVHAATRAQPVPYFIYPHGMLDPWFRRAYPFKHLKKMLYWRLVEQHVLRDAAAVLFTCEEERRLARRTFSPYRCVERVVNYGTAAAPPAIGRQLAAWRERVPGLLHRPFLLFLGRIHRKKGLDLLIEAYRRLAATSPDPPALVIAGPAEDHRWVRLLQNRTNGLPAPARVVWTGLLEGDVKWGALREAEAFVLPSHQENFGLAVVEALSAGTPVLISEQVNIWPEIVAQGAGLAAPDTPAGINGLLEQWSTTEPDRRALMRQCAAQCHARCFDLPAVARSFLAVIGPLLQQPVRS